LTKQVLEVTALTAALADWSNDWSLYPVHRSRRAYVGKRAAPDHDRPADEPGFGRVRRDLADEHLST